MMHIANRKGFTLAEMIIVVIILTILVGMTAPGLFQFLKMRDKQTEETQQEAVRRGLEAYVAANGRLPTDSTATADKVDVNNDGTKDYDRWVVDVSGYTKLTLEQIANDAWGHPRRYIAKSVQQRLDAADVLINYATLMSEGSDYKADAAAGIAVTVSGANSHFASESASGTSGWWSNYSVSTSPTVATMFGNLKAISDSDDMLVKFTDFDQKMANYASTTKRLDRTVGGLESYARANYVAWKDYCTSHSSDTNCQNGMPEKIIYYPPSKSASGVADEGLYFDPNIAPTAAASVKTVTQYENTYPNDIVDNTKTNEAERATQMKRLMQKLGLPTDHCCSSVEMAIDASGNVVRDTTGNVVYKAFYYNSNPRPITSTGCGVRPSSTTLKLPARITSFKSGENETCD